MFMNADQAATVIALLTSLDAHVQICEMYLAVTASVGSLLFGSLTWLLLLKAKDSLHLW
jgi:hypothetical protein